MTDEKRSAALFGVRRSVRYHMHRQAFFDRANDIGSFLVVLLSSGAVFALMGDSKVGPGICALFAAAISAFNLVFAPSRMARKHNDLARRFIVLEQKALQADFDYISLANERLDIESNEPSIYRVVDTICHNELLRSMDKEDSMIQIPFFMRITGHFTDWGFQKLKRSA